MHIIFQLIFIQFCRCEMNAFLAVVIPALGVSNLDDVLSLGYGLTLWGDDAIEHSLALAKEGTVENQLYQR